MAGDESFLKNQDQDKKGRPEDMDKAFGAFLEYTKENNLVGLSVAEFRNSFLSFIISQGRSEYSWHYQARSSANLNYINTHISANDFYVEIITEKIPTRNDGDGGVEAEEWLKQPVLGFRVSLKDSENITRVKYFGDLKFAPHE